MAYQYNPVNGYLDANTYPNPATEEEHRTQANDLPMQALDFINDLDSKKENSTDITNNRKLSPTGNFTGTWHGLMPTQAEPGLTATVNAHLADFVSVKRFSSISQAITEAIGGNFVLYFPDDDYLINDVLAFTLNGDLEIRMGANARIYTLAGHNGKLFQFLDGHLYGYPKFILRGGIFDASNVLVGESNDSIWVSGAGSMIVEASTFKFGADYENAAGDVGIAALNCRNVSLKNNWFFGAPDVGIYVTGGSSSDDSDNGYDTLISGNHFVNCNVGVGLKRQVENTTIIGNSFRRCSIGLQTASTNEPLPPGKNMTVIGNTFKYTGSRAIEVALADGSIIANNTIEDFGKDLSDVDILQAKGIWVSGSKRCTIKNNQIRFKDWTPPAQTRGILLGNYFYNGVNYYSTENDIAGNTIQDVELGIREETLDSGKNNIGFNPMFNVTTEVQTLNSESIFEKRIYGATPARQFGVGTGVKFEINSNGIAINNTGTIKGFVFGTATLDFGSIAANAILELDVALTGAKTGDAVVVTALNSYSSGIEFYGRVSADDNVKIRARNHTSSSIDPTSLTLAIMCFRGVAS
jgi:hypothetical protein